MKYICLLLPAFLAADYEIDEKDSFYKKLVIYSKYCVYINFIMSLVLIILGKATVYFDNLLTIKFYTIYLLVGIVTAKVLPRTIEFCKKNFSIKIRRETK